MAKFRAKATVFSLITFMILSSLLPKISAYSTDFVDVPPNYLYLPYIRYMKDNGISYGFNNGTEYRPESTISRKEITTLIIKSKYTSSEVDKCIASNGYTGKNLFEDVPSTHHFAPFICMAKVKKIAVGYSSGRFGPDDMTTGDAGIKMILRALVDNLPIDINAPLSEYSKYLRDKKGYPTFMLPNDESRVGIKRGEVARVFYAALEQSKDWGLTPSPTPQPTVTLPPSQPIVHWDFHAVLCPCEAIKRTPVVSASTISVKVKREITSPEEIVLLPVEDDGNGNSWINFDYYMLWEDTVEPYAISFQKFPSDSVDVFTFSHNQRSVSTSSPGSGWTVWLVSNY